jgi:Skp family chaperone for outer membrane proteins
MLFTKRNLFICFAAISSAAVSLEAKSEDAPRVVDFGKCYTDSSYGKKEQEGFNQLKDQMEKAIKDLNDQLTETSAKLDDEMVRDSLSPEGEKELQEKMSVLSNELQRYQQQYYYMLQQANMRTMNVIAEKVKSASSELAKKMNYSIIMSKDQVFHNTEKFDVTEEVIAILEIMYQNEVANKEKAQAEVSKEENTKKESVKKESSKKKSSKKE